MSPSISQSIFCPLSTTTRCPCRPGAGATAAHSNIPAAGDGEDHCGTSVITHQNRAAVQRVVCPAPPPLVGWTRRGQYTCRGPFATGWASDSTVWTPCPVRFSKSIRVPGRMRCAGTGARPGKGTIVRMFAPSGRVNERSGPSPRVGQVDYDRIRTGSSVSSPIGLVPGPSPPWTVNRGTWSLDGLPARHAARTGPTSNRRPRNSSTSTLPPAASARNGLRPASDAGSGVVVSCSRQVPIGRCQG